MIPKPVRIDMVQFGPGHPRAEIGDPAEAARYQAMGVKHFCLGWDVGILYGWRRANGTLMRERLGTEETPR